MKDKDKTKEQLINELVEMRQRIAELDASETERLSSEQAGKQAKETIRWSRIWLLTASMFVLLYILVWLNEILDLPHLLLGAPHTPINWREAIIETVLIAIFGLFAVSRLIRDITERKRAEEELRKYRDHLEELVEERTLELAAANEQLQQGGAERKRTEEVVEQRAAQLALLNDIGGKIAAVLELDSVLDRAARLVQESFGYHHVSLFTLDRERGELVMKARAGDFAHLFPLTHRLKLGQGVVGWVGLHGERLLANDVHAEPRYVNLYPDVIPTQSELSVPIQVGEEIVGVLDVQSSQLNAFDENDVVVMGTLADQIAVAIENARLYEAVQQELTERKRAEEALKASQEYTRNIIDSSLDMIIAVNMDRHIVEFNKAAQETFGYRVEEVLGKHVDMLYADPQEGLTVHQTTVEKGQCVQEILDRRKGGQVFPAFLSASVLRDARGELVGVMGVCRDITERKRTEEALRRRNRELAMLHRAGQTFSSTLDLDQVLVTVLEEVRRLLGVTAASVWLTDSETEELVCRQATGPQNEIVRGWRLAPGEGLVGWVARSGESLIVPDARADERHFKDVDQQTGLGLRSILSVPLRVKKGVIGVIQVVDTDVDRFSPTDLTLLEPLATAAAIAIENARLYEQARQDAETRAVLLREVNHRVKNNLTAIIGLLYAERRRAGMEDRAAYQSIMNALINQVQGLATVHSLLSASGWAPLLLSQLTTQVIRSSLQMLPRDKGVSVEVTPSPVRVTPDQAHNLALVINELTTNTVKHALQERDTAHLTVRIALDDDTVLFEFRDDGLGYPEEALQLERQNVGLDLIQNMVHKGLRGELSLHNDHGAVAVIQFRAKA
jgi:PAS domain S-box-containing protein